MRKVLSVVLSALLLISVIPLTSSAATIVDSGKCGDNLTWVFDSESVLTISGTGDMWDFNEGGGAWGPPWSSPNLGDTFDLGTDAIKKIVLEHGITSIGKNAFYGASNITELEIPDSVQAINSYAFKVCQSLKSITIPASVTDIGSGVFSTCSSLTEINVDEKNQFFTAENGALFNKNKTTLVSVPVVNSETIYNVPSGVTKIGDGAFMRCNGLFSIALPEGVTSIGTEAFSDCENLADVYYDGTESQWNNIEILENNDPLLYAAIHFKNTTSEETTIAPEETTVVPEETTTVVEETTAVPDVTNPADNYGVCGDNLTWTLDDEGTLTISGTGRMWDYDDPPTNGGNDVSPWYYDVRIRNVILEEGVTSIGYYAFKGCSSVDTVYLPSTIKEINSDAFPYGLNISNVYYDGTFAQWSKIWIWLDNDSLMDAEIHFIDDDLSVVSGFCGPDVKWDLDKDTGHLTIHGTGYTYGFDGAYSPFYIHRNLIKTVTIGEQIDKINGSVFYICENITDVYYDGTESQWNNIQIEQGNEPILEAIIHFKDINSEETTIAPEATTTVPEETTTVPEETTTVPEENTTVPEETTATPEGTTATPEGTTATPEGTTTVPEGTTATPEGTTTVPEGTTTTPEETTTVPNTSGYYTYTVENGEATITAVDTSISGDVTIPATLGGYPVTAIQYYAFGSCNNITNVTIPASVSYIGYSAFNGCSSLENITVHDDNQYYSSDSYGVLFDKYKTILIQYPIRNMRTSYIIPDTVATIGDCAFESCDSLTSITIPDSVYYICDSAFVWCTNLENITIPDSVTSIGILAFGYCKELESIFIPDSVTYIGNGAFYYCENLASITVDNNNPCFSSDSYGVLFDENKTIVLQYPIGNMRTSYEIPDSVSVIGESAFDTAINLTSIEIPDSVTTIGFRAFYSCQGLVDITIPDSVTTIEQWAFCDCISLTSINIPDSVITIDNVAFCNCVNLETVFIGNSVSSIGNQAFIQCYKLKEIIVDENNNYFSSSADGVLFNKEKTALIFYPSGKENETYAIPDSVTVIKTEAFCENRYLTSITMPDSITTIEDNVFRWYFSVDDVYFEGTKEQWTNISIGEGNDGLIFANIHFKETNPEETTVVPEETTVVPEETTVVPEETTTVPEETTTVPEETTTVPEETTTAPEETTTAPDTSDDTAAEKNFLENILEKLIDLLYKIIEWFKNLFN